MSADVDPPAAPGLGYVSPVPAPPEARAIGPLPGLTLAGTLLLALSLLLDAIGVLTDALPAQVAAYRLVVASALFVGVGVLGEVARARRWTQRSRWSSLLGVLALTLLTLSTWVRGSAAVPLDLALFWVEGTVAVLLLVRTRLLRV